MPTLSAYRLTSVSLTLDMGISLGLLQRSAALHLTKVKSTANVPAMLNLLKAAWVLPLGELTCVLSLRLSSGLGWPSEAIPI